MNFDFDALYKEKSSVELLRVLFKAKDFQPQAIEAVENILASRDVTDEDRKAAGFTIWESVDQISNSDYPDHKRVDQDLLDAFNPDEHEQKSSALFNMFLLLGSLYYLRIAYTAVKSLFFAFSYESFPLYYVLYASVYVLLIPIAFYRLYKRQPFGWYVIFGETLLALISSLIYIGSSWRSISSASLYNIVLILFPMIIRPAFLYFLWQKKNSEDLGVLPQYKKRTVLICGGFVVVVAALLWAAQSGQSF